MLVSPSSPAMSKCFSLASGPSAILEFIGRSPTGSHPGDIVGAARTPNGPPPPGKLLFRSKKLRRFSNTHERKPDRIFRPNRISFPFCCGPPRLPSDPPAPPPDLVLRAHRANRFFGTLDKDNVLLYDTTTLRGWARLVFQFRRPLFPCGRGINRVFPSDLWGLILSVYRQTHPPLFRCVDPPLCATGIRTGPFF